MPRKTKKLEKTKKLSSKKVVGVKNKSSQSRLKRGIKKIKAAKLKLICGKKDIELKTKNHLLKISKKRLLVYIVLMIALFSVIWGFSSLKAKSMGREYSTIISAIGENKKALEVSRADAAKEDLLTKENSFIEDFNAKIKDVDFEKLSFEKNIPILMYHYIEPESPTQSSLRRALGVTPENFDQQMKWLYDNGFETLTLSEYFSLIAGQKDIPKKSILITVDDGYRDFFENAAPILLRYNMTATIFIITDLIGSSAFMDWDQVKLLSDQGFEFDSHSLTHPNLRNAIDDKLKSEVVDSKKKIEEKTGKNVNFFCYPTGAYDARVEKAIRAAGYRGAFTTMNGYKVSNKNMFELPRIRITHTMSLDGFAWAVNSVGQNF